MDGNVFEEATQSTNVEISEEDILAAAPNVGEELNSEPCKGMEFKSVEKVREFYNSFAKRMGFGVRVRSTKPKRAVFVCCNEGHHIVKSSINKEIQDDTNQTKRKCSTSRTGCLATLVVKRGTLEGNWIICSFKNDHNHPMVSPKSVSYMRCHKSMNGAAKSLVEHFKEEGIPTGKVATMFSEGDLAFSNRDCWNHVRSLRRKNLDVGDAQAVFNYCKQKQVENSNFFYEIQCDEDSRMINFFWVDARSRLAYQQFGDVISFDTTYKTNKYSMPFAPFVGLNNHYQSILFGCALLQDESERSFIWLFETFLKAMDGKKPKSVITDQDLAMKAALGKVFPETRHRLCLWHIRKKFAEKLAHVYHKNSTFKRELKKCIHVSPSIESFEEDWSRLMIEYGLDNNEWLQGLYKIRESWIPVYNRSCFFAGMNTSQRSESINAFFDSFVNATTTLQEFVLKFEKAVDSRLEVEKREDYESRHKKRILSTGSKLEEHAASIYSRNIFGKFQDEIGKIYKFAKKKISKDGPNYVYQVSSNYNARDMFLVDVNLDTQIAKCGCQLYEFLGILCRHILVIFQAKGITQIPDHFILQRWTKNANKSIEVCDTTSNFDGQNSTPKILRRMHAQQEAKVLVDLAEESDEIYKFIISDLRRTRMAAIAMKKSNLAISDGVSPLESGQNVNQNCLSEEESEPELTIRNPRNAQTKGRKKDGEKNTQNCRFKSGIELSHAQQVAVKRKACHECGESGHNSRTCKKRNQND